MALDVTEVRVAGSGSAWIAPEDTAFPVDFTTAPASPWAELGYITEAGATFTVSRTTTDLNAWQGTKLRVLTTAEPMTVEFALMQTDPDTILAALGGGTITPGSGIATIEPPAFGDNNIVTLMVEFVDGTIHYRYQINRAQIQGDVVFKLMRSDAVNYPLTFGVLENVPKWTIVTDDPAIVAGGLGADAEATPEAAPEPEPSYT
jgi:hypothetical protein